MKRIASVLTVITLLASLFCFGAAAEGTVQVTLRIEGINSNFYYDTLKLEENATVLDALKMANADADLDMKGLEEGYITEVNGEAAATFGGWDGWLFRVNGISPTVSCREYVLQNNDQIVFYYSDEYGVGMQFPQVEVLENGVIRFTSEDVTYDADFNPVTQVNSVTGAQVTLEGKTYQTDENGEISVGQDITRSGEYRLQIERYADSGVPTVLRLAPDFTVSLTAGVSETETNDVITTTTEGTNAPDENESNTSPKTGVSTSMFGVLAVALSAGVVLKLTKKHEK